MGVKELNLVFKTCPNESFRKRHDVVIIDGSNLMFQSLSSQISKLKKNGFIIKQWNSFSLPLVNQMIEIINNSVSDISGLLNSYYKSGTKEIYVVIDPIETPQYIINTHMEYNHEYENLIARDNNIKEILNSGNDIVLNLKTAEQEVRRKRTSKNETIEKEINYIQLLKEKCNLSEEDVMILINVFKQSYCFNDPSVLLKLSWIVLKQLDVNFHNKGFYIVDCIDEADLVIKNIAYKICNENETNDETNDETNNVSINETNETVINEQVTNETVTNEPNDVDINELIDAAEDLSLNNENEYIEQSNSNSNSNSSIPSILILSMDTDYLILFADMPNVDVAQLQHRSTIYNPVKCWKNILGQYYSYELVIRIAPILGNDYTVHEMIISAKNFDDVLSLFNVNGQFSSLKFNQRKKVYKVVDGARQQNGLIDFKYLDDLIYGWNSAYFLKYFLSVTIYTNWNTYNKYNIVPQQNNIMVEEETSKVFRKILEYINESYKDNETITLYEWDSTMLFVNWDEFFDTIKANEFNTFEDCLDYYYEVYLQYTKDDIDNDAEFLE